MGLFASKWKSKNPVKRNNWIGKASVDNKEHLTLLTDLAKNDNDESVRLNASNKISDAKLLYDIAQNTSCELVQANCIHRIDNETLQLQIAKTEPNEILRKLAFDSISSNSLIVQIAESAKYEDVAKKAIGKIEDENILIKIIQSEQAGIVRGTAISKIKDDKTISGLIANEDDAFVLIAACRAINNEQMLIEIAKKATQNNVIRTALGKVDLSKLSDPQLLENAVEVLDGNKKLAIIKKISNTGLLYRLFKEEDDTSLKNKLLDSIILNKGFDELVEIATTEDDEIAQKAVQGIPIEQQESLLKIVNYDGKGGYEFYKTKQLTFSKISDQKVLKNNYKNYPYNVADLIEDIEFLKSICGSVDEMEEDETKFIIDQKEKNPNYINEHIERIQESYKKFIDELKLD